jgi:hypothetical protein
MQYFDRIYTFEPEWRTERVEQIIGRAVRMPSHSQIPIIPIYSYTNDNSKTIKASNYITPTDCADKLECAICLDTNDIDDTNNENDTNIFSQVSCNHKFHTLCITKWIEKTKTKPSCPCCRANLTEFVEYDEKEKLIVEHINDKINQLNLEKKEFVSNLLSDGYSWVKVKGFKNLKISFELINWFLQTYLSKSDIIFDDYLKLTCMYTKKNFGYGGMSINSKKLVLGNLTKKIIRTNIAYANYAIWIAKNNIEEKIIKVRQLFLIPDVFIKN